MLALHSTICYWLTCWVTFTLAQFDTFTPPGQNEITYTVNIPQQTATSGSGPIFIQMKATSDVQWFAWGQGAVMQGANIFVVYATENNITVSPRLGIEHVMPLYNPQAQVSVLDGSGIDNGITTVNLRCDSCITWAGGHEDVTSSSSLWVWAVKYGSILDSTSITASITIHDMSGVASLNLKQATGGSSENPFLGASSSGSSSSSSSGLAQAVTTLNSQSLNKRRVAHAVIMIFVFIILLPIFALALHLFLPVKGHACLQLFALALAIAGLGIGISMATSLHLTGSYHPIIGIVVVSCLVLFQPALGFLQHRYFLRTGKKSMLAYLHRWFGRTVITLGIINAGLGFRLTGIGSSLAPVGAVIAYGVVAGVVWVGYVLIVTLLSLRKRHSLSA